MSFFTDLRLANEDMFVALKDVTKKSLDLARNPKHTKWVAPVLTALDAILCVLIIAYRPYTEIDWKAYMQQVSLYIKGETNYYNLTGDTGPLVYPGLHVYIYRVLYYLTQSGTSILTAQCIFALGYLGTLATVMSCYRSVRAPPYLFPLLVGSIRLHSIFMLRLFNDCFAVYFLWLGVHLYQHRRWYSGTLVLSMGLGVKMSVLLVFPALLAIWPQALGLEGSITQALIVLQSQGLFAYEFVRTHWKAYAHRAFELTRQFQYKWTVNWRFIPEPTFLSKPFSLTLLTLHASLLLLFATTRWNKPSQRSLPATIRLYLSQPPNWQVTAGIARRASNPDFIMSTVLGANVIGMLCARSLHYQFFAWIAWATPYLLWRARLHPVAIYVVWGAQEWAWMQFPSTGVSSAVVVGSLAVQVGGIWWGTGREAPVYGGKGRVVVKKEQ